MILCIFACLIHNFAKAVAKQETVWYHVTKKEVIDVEKKRFIAELAKKTAEKALRRDANSTTCLGIYQPKAPAELKRFKNVK